MKNYDEYERALNQDPSYAASLSKSMALVLEEFYEKLHNVGISAVSAEGMDDFFTVRHITLVAIPREKRLLHFGQSVQSCVDEYEVDYRPELERNAQDQINREIERQKVPSPNGIRHDLSAILDL